ncbi:MAG: hypothetical protein K6T30_03095 [Alicyclobacillus sp.]|nr:hypothetical protein [Alicyclobacillus sp.]
MAAPAHAVTCPNCHGTLFREERLVQLDSSVVIRDGLPLPARTVGEQYRYVCASCGQVLDTPWTGHHDQR